jgi:hypothetical protein
MKIALFFVMIALAGVLDAKDRVILARFEVTGRAGPVQVEPKSSVTFYRSPPGVKGMEEFVDVEIVHGKETTSRGLDLPAAGTLLDAFETAHLPALNYQEHFEQLRKMPPEIRRGMGYGGRMGGAPLVRFELKPPGKDLVFEIWDPESCFYGHPSDEVAQSVYRLILACRAALASGDLYR